MTFLFGVALLDGASFKNNQNGCELSGSFNHLHACNISVGIWDFCHGDASTCHVDTCQGLQHQFCDLHLVAFILCILLGMLLMFSTVLGFAQTREIPTQNVMYLAQINFWLHVIIIVVFILILSLWGGAKGELPGWSADHNRFLYLPASKSNSWSLGWAFGLAICLMFVMGFTALLSRLTMQKLREITRAASELVDEEGGGGPVVHLDNPMEISPGRGAAASESYNVPVSEWDHSDDPGDDFWVASPPSRPPDALGGRDGAAGRADPAQQAKVKGRASARAVRSGSDDQRLISSDEEQSDDESFWHKTSAGTVPREGHDYSEQDSGAVTEPSQPEQPDQKRAKKKVKQNSKKKGLEEEGDAPARPLRLQGLVIKPTSSKSTPTHVRDVE